jgi:hypothetical protein
MVMSSRTGKDFTVPSKASLSVSSHCGTLRPSRASRAPAIRATFRDFSTTTTLAPCLTSIDGMLAFLPFRRKCPWRTSCLASAREVAKPSRKTTLSSRRSSKVSRFSPARPLIRVARVIVRANCFSRRPYILLTFCFSRSWIP